MSGGSYDYMYEKVERYFVGAMHDMELDEMLGDLVEVLHDLEWWRSGDITGESYYDTVEKFKKKWFLTDRNERLKGYVDSQCNALKARLYRLIGGSEKDEA